MTDNEVVADKPVEEMTKNELAEYATVKFGLNLDLAQKKDELLKLVQDKMKEPSQFDDPVPEATKTAPGKPGKAKPDKGPQQYLKHPGNGRVYAWTEHLAARGDMVSCDHNGKPL